jgi:tRNA (guanosine-2'-O-)-methyltransferase
MPKPISQPEPIVVRGRPFEPARVVELLSPFVSDARQTRIEDVIANRTYTVTPVIEGLFDLGNVSAVIRSAEALGYQSVHVIESSEEFKSSPRTTQGSDKWLDITRWETSRDCVDHLRRLGYRVMVTHLEASTRLDDVDFTKPTALVFGNEANGVSDEMLKAADGRCIIPMLGFVESFNISVAAAVALYAAYRQRLSRLGSHGDLDDIARVRLRASFYMKSVKEPEAILTRLA